MSIGHEQITIRVDGEVLHLRPQLGAACRLFHRHGGFDPLVRAIADCNIGVMADVIAECADTRTAFADFLRHIERSHLQGAQVLIEPLLKLVLALAGVDEDQADEPRATTEPVSYADHFERLFQLGTGWMGWSASEAWAATPTEIIAAYKGRIDMLQSIFGGADAEPKAETELSRDQFKAFVAAGGNVGG